MGMARTLFALFLFALAAPLSAPLTARAQELRNDGWEGGTAPFQGGFVSGEIAASRFTPPGPSVLTEVRFLFGGAPGMRNVTLVVWEDAAGGTTPGTEIYRGDYAVTAADTALTSIDLTGLDVRVSGPFRVGIVMTADGLPSIARDDDGTIDGTKNFISAGVAGWASAVSFGLPGDWILRAVVRPDSDAGVADVGITLDAAVADGGALDASTFDAAGSTDSGIVTDSGTGMSCGSNADCDLGQYCGATGRCTFDCRTNSDCAGGGTCSSLGRCVAPETGGCACSARRRVDELAGGPLALLVLGLALGARRARRKR